MDNTKTLEAIRRLYPGNEYNIRVLGADGDPHVLLYKRAESFSDGLSMLRRYRVLSPYQHKLVACISESDTVDMLLAVGVSEDKIETSFTDMLMECIMLIDLKVKARDELVSEDLVSRARIKKDAIEAEFHKVKSDPSLLSEFLNRLISGDGPKPTLSLVEETPSED